MAEIGLTDDDYARLADGIDARSVNSGDSNGEITTEQCAEWRRRVRLHARYADIANDAGVSSATVSNHVRDKCSHDVDEPAPVSGGDR